MFSWFCCRLFLFLCLFFWLRPSTGPVAWVPFGRVGWRLRANDHLSRKQHEKEVRWTYSAYTERGKPKVRSSLERGIYKFQGAVAFQAPPFLDRFFDHFSGSRPGWAAFSLDFCDLVAFCLGETDGGCKMAKIGAFSINCMDRRVGKGKKPQSQSSPHVLGSDKSMPLTMMLSKALKVANESVHATPLRWPLAFHHLRPSFPCVCETDCFK